MLFMQDINSPEELREIIRNTIGPAWQLDAHSNPYSGLAGAMGAIDSLSVEQLIEVARTLGLIE